MPGLRGWVSISQPEPCASHALTRIVIKCASPRVAAGRVFAGARAVRYYVESAIYCARRDWQFGGGSARPRPRQALDGGLDGLDAYRHICRIAPDYLETGGHLVLEIGHNQLQQVSDLMRAEGFQNLSVDNDLEARARVVRGQIKNQKGV